MPNNIEAVIFDWAGTTVDFGCMAPVQAFVQAFKKSGLEVTIAETREPMGMTKRDHVETMLKMPRISDAFKEAKGRAFTQDDVDTIYNDFQEQLFVSLADYTEPKPLVLETVKQLREDGIKIGSTTGYTAKMMEVVSPNAKEKGYEPDCMFCADDVDNYGRPYPYMIFAAMQKLGITSVKNTIKVGDTKSDIEEGVNAGVWTVGIIEGSSEAGLSAEEFEQLSEQERQDLSQKVEAKYRSYGADFVIKDLSGIFEVIQHIQSHD
ncbi:phosphonoacetaldehyde hydrolase [Brackiella oedipodis]|uniref:phosphonoacetaldehyde hydrolase n=1 Tax=Brackiella oedipodis TaxID=124225 RepID=UPI00056E7FD1|nr:phosphonoacetaldehyde hydrolase [Brackiella oedipodis]